MQALPAKNENKIYKSVTICDSLWKSSDTPT